MKTVQLTKKDKLAFYGTIAGLRYCVVDEEAVVCHGEGDYTPSVCQSAEFIEFLRKRLEIVAKEDTCIILWDFL